MPTLSTIDFAIFCLTVIALVAIAHHKEEIVITALTLIGKVVSMLKSQK